MRDQEAVALSVVIVSWNTRELLAQCLASIEAHPPEVRYEVWVVDNASTDGSVDMVRRRFPRVQLIENTMNAGFARANNQALAVSRGRYVLLLNSDTVMQLGSLATMAQQLDDRPQAGAAGPQMIGPDGSFQNSYGKLPSVWDEILGPYWQNRLAAALVNSHLLSPTNQWQGVECIQTERVSFACTMIRRQALEEVGLLDERFVFYSEDYDWFKRLKDAGWRVLFCPQAQVVHHWGASSSKRSEWSQRQLYRSKRLYVVKHHGRGAERLLRAGLILRFTAKALVEYARWPWRRQEARGGWRQQIRLIHQLLKPVQRAPKEMTR